MDDCCARRTPGGYDGEFDERFARRLARRYRRRGLSPAAQGIVDFVVAGHAIKGASVLEIGGGIGDIQVELLKHGAATATNLELSGGYETEALRLLRNHGFAQRVRRVLDIDLARTPEAVAPADIVVLHRVVCCYPDAERLLDAAAAHARHMVVFTHPPHNWLTRCATGLVNAWCTLLGQEYRAFAHDPLAMIAVLERRGFTPEHRRTAGAWRIIGALRG